MNRDHAVRRWRWPVTLALLTILGLLAALFDGDAMSHWFCWFSLALPLAILLRVLSPGATVRTGQDA